MEEMLQVIIKVFYKKTVGSLFELQTQLEIARNLNYLTKDNYDAFFERTNELDRMLFSLIKKIN